MKLYNSLGVVVVLSAIALPASGQPSASPNPFRIFHTKHPEKSNPHYKDATHGRGSGNHRGQKQKRHQS